MDFPAGGAVSIPSGMMEPPRRRRAKVVRVWQLQLPRSRHNNCRGDRQVAHRLPIVRLGGRPDGRPLEFIHLPPLEAVRFMSRRDIVKIARHFSAGIYGLKLTMSPAGTTDISRQRCPILITGFTATPSSEYWFETNEICIGRPLNRPYGTHF